MREMSRAVRDILRGDVTGIRSAALTFAAEAVGRHYDSAVAVPALLLLLQHRDPVVREGTLVGLGYHLELETTRTAMCRVARCDPVEVLRGIAAEFLRQYQDVCWLTETDMP